MWVLRNRLWIIRGKKGKIKSKYERWYWKATMILQQEKDGTVTSFLKNWRKDLKFCIIETLYSKNSDRLLG